MLSVQDPSIQRLRQYQKRSREGLGLSPSRTEEEILALAMRRADEREAQAVRDGSFIREHVFKYPAPMEALRWKRTREVINRVVPGMDEDPVYLELLARQAASIEIILRQEHTGFPNPKGSALCDRVLLGTVADLDLEAFSVPAADHALVVLSAGLISILYQAEKSVVLSWRPVKPGLGSTISLSPKAADVDHTLKMNPYPVGLLYKTLHQYLFKGYSRATDYDPPPAEYIPALLVLINHSERFVIAHEYGHALLHQLASSGVLPAEHASWPKEFEADCFAFFFEVVSARELDHLPANVALQGGLFMFSVLEVLRKALSVVRYGEVSEDVGSETHPPTQQRIEYLKQMYAQHVGVQVKYDLPQGTSQVDAKPLTSPLKER